MQDHLDHDTSIDPSDLASLILIRSTPVEVLFSLQVFIYLISLRFSFFDLVVQKRQFLLILCLQ